MKLFMTEILVTVTEKLRKYYILNLKGFLIMMKLVGTHSFIIYSDELKQDKNWYNSTKGSLIIDLHYDRDKASAFQSRIALLSVLIHLLTSTVIAAKYKIDLNQFFGYFTAGGGGIGDTKHPSRHEFQNK